MVGQTWLLREPKPTGRLRRLCLQTHRLLSDAGGAVQIVLTVIDSFVVHLFPLHVPGVCLRRWSSASAHLSLATADH